MQANLPKKRKDSWSQFKGFLIWLMYFPTFFHIEAQRKQKQKNYWSVFHEQVMFSAYYQSRQYLKRLCLICSIESSILFFWTAHC